MMGGWPFRYKVKIMYSFLLVPCFMIKVSWKNILCEPNSKKIKLNDIIENLYLNQYIHLYPQAGWKL